MRPSGASPAGDQATVSISVAVEPAVAFEVFTQETDWWWRRGLRYRLAGRRRRRGVQSHDRPVAGGAHDRTARIHRETSGRLTPGASGSWEWRNAGQSVSSALSDPLDRPSVDTPGHDGVRI